MKDRTCSRRSFLKKTGISLLAWKIPPRKNGGQPAKKETRKRPNILFAIADDWSYPHAGIYGDKVVKTPAFDRIASEGILFTNAFCSVSSCTASRASILTGQIFWRLGPASELYGDLPSEHRVYPFLLREHGYAVAWGGDKGCGPGCEYELGNPAGGPKRDIGEFLDSIPAGTPWCYWFGTLEPHRGYKKGSGKDSGMRLEDVELPPVWPDADVIKSDVCDYYYEVQVYDSRTRQVIEEIERRDMLEDTIVVMTSDNGMPFPRAKGNMYQLGAHVPLAVRWGRKVKPGRVVDDFISFDDFAPTLLEACGVDVPSSMTGKGFLDILLAEGSGCLDVSRGMVFGGLNKHKVGSEPYPIRSIRTREYLYIWNLEPEKDPISCTPGDVVRSPTGVYMKSHAGEDPKMGFLNNLWCDECKRPEEELYDLRSDPWELDNLAGDPEYEEIQSRLRRQLLEYMQKTNDPKVKE